MNDGRTDASPFSRARGGKLPFALDQVDRDVLSDPDHAALAAEIGAMGRRALPLQMNVMSLAEINDAVAAAIAYFGRLDILVNNAGIAPENLAENVTESDFDATLAVNLKGTFFASQAAGRAMIRQGYGRIINVGSQAGFIALPGGIGTGGRRGSAQPRRRRGVVVSARPASASAAPGAGTGASTYIAGSSTTM